MSNTEPRFDISMPTYDSLLAPIGVYRATIPKSKGKKHRKRKRGDTDSTHESKDRDNDTPIKALNIQNQLLIGFNQVTRHLEKLSTDSRKKHGSSTPDETPTQHIAVVFLLRPLDDLMYSHIPTLCYTASAAHPELPPTRLVVLDSSVETRVLGNLSQSRSVSVLAVLDGGQDLDGLDKLVGYVREHVEPIDVPWLREAREGKWLGMKID